MEITPTKEQPEEDYPYLFKFSKSIRTFLSQPLRFLAVLLCLQLGIAIYFIVTIKHSGVAVAVVTILCYIATTLLNAVFPFVDPGIIPKLPLKNFIEEIPIKYHQYAKERRDGIFMNKEFGQTIKTHTLNIKFCGNCSIFRPPRTIHCYTCGACIQKMDHHCPWLGMCIGKRNYTKYLCYIVFMEATTILLCVQSLMYAVNQPFQENEAAFIFNILLISLSTPSCLFVSSLIFIHFKLSRENLTTNEFYHQKWMAQGGNPYEKNVFIKNWMKLFQLSYQTKNSFNEENFNKMAKEKISESTKIFKPSTHDKLIDEKPQYLQSNAIQANTSLNGQQQIQKPSQTNT